MTPEQELRLHDYIMSITDLPFAYGQNDCPLLAFGVLDCMDGGDRRARMSGLWGDKASAWRYMRRHGDIATHLMDEGCVVEPRGLPYAQVGDLLLMQRELAHDKRWHSVAVCLGKTAAVMTEEKGLIRVRLTDLPTVTQVLRWSFPL